MKIDIPIYLREISHSVDTLLQGIWDESNQLDSLKAERDSLGRATTAGYERAMAIATDAEDPDDVAMAAGVHWDTYFGSDKESFHVQEKITALEARIQAHRFSIDSLSSALLQHAKQGISLHHGGLASCPNGRLIGSQPIKTVIWEGRNQSIHWEEGAFNKKVDDCFAKLSAEIDPKFGSYKSRSMAFDLISLLEWRTTANFEADIDALK